MEQTAGARALQEIDEAVWRAVRESARAGEDMEPEPRFEIISGFKVEDTESEQVSALQERAKDLNNAKSRLIKKWQALGVKPLATLPMAAWAKMCSCKGLYRFENIETVEDEINGKKVVKSRVTFDASDLAVEIQDKALAITLTISCILVQAFLLLIGSTTLSSAAITSFVCAGLLGIVFAGFIFDRLPGLAVSSKGSTIMPEPLQVCIALFYLGVPVAFLVGITLNFDFPPNPKIGDILLAALGVSMAVVVTCTIGVIILAIWRFSLSDRRAIRMMIRRLPHDQLVRKMWPGGVDKKEGAKVDINFPDPPAEMI